MSGLQHFFDRLKQGDAGFALVKSRGYFLNDYTRQVTEADGTLLTLIPNLCNPGTYDAVDKIDTIATAVITAKTLNFWDGTQKRCVWFSAGNGAVFIPEGVNTIFKNSHEVHLVAHLYALNASTATQYLFGVNVGSTFNYTVEFENASNKIVLRMYHRNAGVESVIRSVEDVRTADSQFVYYRHVVDLENDRFEMWVNGAKLSWTQVSGDTPAQWTNSHPSSTTFGIAFFARHNGANISGFTPKNIFALRAAVTGLFTQDEFNTKVAPYMMS